MDQDGDVHVRPSSVHSHRTNKYGPTEYVFCYLAAMLQKMCCPGWTLEDLQVAIIQILSQFGCDGVNDIIFIYALTGGV